MSTIRYISLFSGIEAATVAWHQLGWKPIAYAEIEPFPKAVLRQHYPEVPDFGRTARRMPLPPNRVQRRGRSDEPQTSQHATKGMTSKQMLPMRLVRLAYGTSGGTARQEPSTGIVWAF